jgi:hypothetical protein
MSMSRKKKSLWNCSRWRKLKVHATWLLMGPMGASE